MNMFPTLVVGLGGSGKLVCKFLKKIFMERFPKEWLEPTTGLPPIVNILAIETQPGKEKEETDIDLPDIPIIEASINQDTLIAMQKKSYLNKNPEIKDWLYTPLPIKEIIGGAGQIRQAGRLAYFRNRNAFAGIENILETSINSIKDDQTISKIKTLTNGTIEVLDTKPRCYLISSVCGGTGSGMLLDVAGFLRKKGTSTRLIAFLPKMFEEIIDLPEAVWLTYANTYATIKEINHYMSGGKWSVWYKESARDGVQIDEKIFDWCFLVEKENEKIDLIDRKHVAPLIAEFLFWQISEIENSLVAISSNTKKFIDKELKNWCSSIGIATISFPLKEIKNILLNWGTRDILSKHLSDDFKADDITNEITDPNTGLLFSTFNYENWEQALLERKEYSILSTDTIIKRKGSLANKIKTEKNRLGKEYERDKLIIEKNFQKYTEQKKESLKKILNEKLTTKGLTYYKYFIEEFKKALNDIKLKLIDEQQSLESKTSELNNHIQKNLSILTQISKKKKFVDLGWKKRIEPHVRNMLRLIKTYFENLLLCEKHKHSIKIIKELEELIDNEITEFDSLLNKLDIIRKNKKIEENKLWAILGYTSAAQIKVKSNYKDVKELYENYLNEKNLASIGNKLKEKLLDWKDKSINEIEKEILNALRKNLSSQNFDNLTIIDVMKDNLDNLGNIFKDCMNNKSRSLVKHMKHYAEDKFIITGFEHSELSTLPAVTQNYNHITSKIESSKRNITFIRLSSGFSVEDLGPFGFREIYAEAYKDYINQGKKWIHLFPEAIGFEDPLEEISVGMEEEALIKTCQCVGIIWENRSHHYMYKKAGKNTVIGQGLKKTIRKLQDNPDIANELKKRLIQFFNNKDLGWIKAYLIDHDIKVFADEDDYINNHKNKYKNKEKQYQYPLPPHKIPSYILDEINSRIKRGRK